MSTYQQAKHVLRHPLDFFYDIQSNGKWSQAIIIVLLAIVARMASLMLTGFSFQTRETFQISALLEAMWIVSPWITWVVANWAVSTILDGEGKFKDIFVGSAFALVPYVVFAVPIALISNIMSLSESAIYSTFNWFILLWVVLLILMKIKVVHDFESGKMIFITFLTIVGVLVIWFIGLLLFALVTQASTFVMTIIKEISFRL